MTRFRFIAICGFAGAASLSASAAYAQVAPVQYWNMGGPVGFGGTTALIQGDADEDGFRKGFSFRSFSYPVSSFGSGFAWGGIGAFGSSGLASEGAQYGYSFKGIGNTPVTLFGGVNTLRTTPDVFTALTMPGFESSKSLATSFNAGVEFKPTSNISLSLSAGVVQPSAATDSDLRSQFLSGQQQMFLGGRR